MVAAAQRRDGHLRASGGRRRGAGARAALPPGLRRPGPAGGFHRHRSARPPGGPRRRQPLAPGRGRRRPRDRGADSGRSRLRSPRRSTPPWARRWRVSKPGLSAWPRPPRGRGAGWRSPKGIRTPLPPCWGCRPAPSTAGTPAPPASPARWISRAAPTSPRSATCASPLTAPWRRSTAARRLRTLDQIRDAINAALPGRSHARREVPHPDLAHAGAHQPRSPSWSRRPRTPASACSAPCPPSTWERTPPPPASRARATSRPERTSPSARVCG